MRNSFIFLGARVSSGEIFFRIKIPNAFSVGNNSCGVTCRSYVIVIIRNYYYDEDIRDSFRIAGNISSTCGIASSFSGEYFCWWKVSTFSLFLSSHLYSLLKVSIQWKDLYGVQTEPFQLHICSGIIIHEKYILTTANCLLTPIMNTDFRFDMHENIYLGPTQPTFCENSTFDFGLYLAFIMCWLIIIRMRNLSCDALRHNFQSHDIYVCLTSIWKLSLSVYLNFLMKSFKNEMQNHSH